MTRHDARLTIEAADGRRLAATMFRGSADSIVVLAGGTGIPQRFYSNFATWLATRGPTVVSFDYRGVGLSREPGDLRRPDMGIRTWGTLDLDAVLRHATARSSTVSLLGHSVGGQLLGLASSHPAVVQAVHVASQSGYWRLAPRPERYRLWAYWHVLFPSLVNAMGHLPAARLGLGEDLPGAVVREWARWCRDPDYLFGDRTLDSSGYAEVDLPIHAIHVADDPWASLAAVQALHERYRSASVEVTTVTPGMAGGVPLGHLGVFRDRAAALWPLVAESLIDARAAASPG